VRVQLLSARGEVFAKIGTVDETSYVSPGRNRIARANTILLFSISRFEGRFAVNRREVFSNHLAHQVMEADAMAPT